MAFSCEDRDAATRAFSSRTSVEVREPISKVTMPLFAEWKAPVRDSLA